MKYCFNISKKPYSVGRLNCSVKPIYIQYGLLNIECSSQLCEIDDVCIL